MTGQENLVSKWIEHADYDLTDSHTLLMDRLARYYIVGRYPTFKQKLATSLTENDAASILEETKELVTWFKKSMTTSATS